MNYAVKIVAGLFGLFAVAATLYGWFLAGGPFLVILVPALFAAAYFISKKVE